MRLVAPELLADLCGLSPGLIGLAAVAGAVLLLMGWWSHRFWVVLIATVSAGVFGLYQAPILNTQPLVASLLLALAAGLLALALIRLFAFVLGGAIGLTVVQLAVPQFEQPLIAFLATGLLGLVLFRWCVTALMSFLGSMLLVHAALIFFNQRGSVDAAAYAEQSAALLTGAVGGMTFVGFIFQLWMERRRRQKPEDEKPAKRKSRGGDDEFKAMFGKLTRKAG